jgi:small subunit ribosomal protein S8
MVTDTIGNFIISLKNGNLAGKESVSSYTSKIKEAIADALVRAEYVKSFSKNGKMIEVVLNYKSDKSPKIMDVQRISKPSKRVYQKTTDIKPFKNGFGAIIVSTPSGVLSNREAVKQKVGGEVLFKIW